MPSKEDPEDRRWSRPRTGRRTSDSGAPRRLDFGRQYRCPTCLVEVDPDSVRVSTFDGRVGTDRMRVASAFDALRGPRRVPLEAQLEMRRFTCRRGHLLPDELFSIGLMPIALLGLSQSMKTHYVGAIAKQLVRDYRLAALDGQRSLVFRTLDECYERLSKEYVEPLFDRHEVLVPTLADRGAAEPVRDPITFEAEFQPRPHAMSRSKRRYISLYDAPGEMFKLPQNRLVHAPYLLDPGGVLLFADVGAMPEVRRRLDGGAPEHFTVLDPQIVVSAARSMRAHRGGRGALDVPVSVIVSRADLLRDKFAFTKYARALGREPLLEDEANVLARDFVSEYAPGIVIETASAFGDQVRYFFASATGHAPHDDHFPDVQPWGCLGPLLHILTANGFATS